MFKCNANAHYQRKIVFNYLFGLKESFEKTLLAFAALFATVFRFRGTRWREYLERFSLLGSESAAVRYLHLEMQIQVAKAPAVELLHAHSLQHLLRLWLRSLGNFHLLFPLQSGYL